MKLAIFSDLHIEFGQPWVPPEGLDYDVLVLAGDVHKHTRGVEQFQDWPKPVIYVPGNHEFYGAHLFGLLSELRRKARGTSVRFLENDAAELDGVRFLGTTLWTDYSLFDPTNRYRYMREAERTLYDHRLIRVSEGADFRPKDALKLHQKARAWLNQALTEPFDGPTVVVTHHLPAPGSVAPRFRLDPVSPAFASDLTRLIEQHQPDLWIHGHTHVACDYQLGRTRVICNPRGYPREFATGFRPDLVVEVLP